MLCVFPSPVVTFPIDDKCVTIDICSVLIKLASTSYHNIFSAGLRGYAFIVYQVDMVNLIARTYCNFACI